MKTVHYKELYNKRNCIQKCVIEPFNTFLSICLALLLMYPTAGQRSPVSSATHPCSGPIPANLGLLLLSRPHDT